MVHMSFSGALEESLRRHGWKCECGASGAIYSMQRALDAGTGGIHPEAAEWIIFFDDPKRELPVTEFQCPTCLRRPEMGFPVEITVDNLRDAYNRAAGGRDD